MKAALIALPALALTLSACSGRADGELEPGQWKQTVTIKSLEAPKAPPQAQQALAKMAGKVTTNESCMGADDAKQGVKSMAEAMQQGGKCTVGKFETAGGKIAGNFDCKLTAAGSSTMELTGNYEPTKITMNAKNTETNPSVPGGVVVVNLEIKAERVGECKKN